MKRKLNVKLLRKIQKHITEEPRRFYMAGPVTRAKTQEEWTQERNRENNSVKDLSKKIPPCGTAACICGWVNILTNCRKGTEGNITRAEKELRLPSMRKGFFFDPHHALFFDYDWPEPFRSRYQKAATTTTRAKIACQRIDHLIKTGE